MWSVIKNNPRRSMAWLMLGLSIVGWPTSLFLAPEEPPIVMSLSWLALIYTSVTILFAAEIEEK